MTASCQSKTLRRGSGQASSQVKPSPKKNFNATPLSFGHLPIFKKRKWGESPRHDSRRENCVAFGRNYAGINWESILAPSAFGTSPKYDKKKSECRFKIYIVVFGGGRVGVVDFYCHKAALVIELDGVFYED